MKTTLVAALAALLAACGGDTPKEPPPSPGAPPAAVAPTYDTPRSVVEAYLAAATKPDEAAMLALGTPEWQTREKTWKKAFTFHIVQKGFKLKSSVVRDPEVDGDKANVSVKAVFVGEGGKDDNEGMRFVLAKKDGRWWITELH